MKETIPFQLAPKNYLGINLTKEALIIKGVDPESSKTLKREGRDQDMATDSTLTNRMSEYSLSVRPTASNPSPVQSLGKHRTEPQRATHSHSDRAASPTPCPVSWPGSLLRVSLSLILPLNSCPLVLPLMGPFLLPVTLQ